MFLKKDFTNYELIVSYQWAKNETNNASKIKK